MTKNRILITGASGFIGSSVLDSLSRQAKYELAIVVRQTSNTASAPPDIPIYRLKQSYDSIEEVLLSFKPNLVIHCATLFLAEHSSENLQDLIEANLTFSLNLLEAMNAAGCKKILNIGSMWQHHLGIEGKPVNLYSAMKNAFESLLDYYVNACGFQSSTIYFSDTYGPNDKRRKLINILIQKINSKDCSPLEMSPGLQKLDLLHVSDVISALKLLVNALLMNEAVKEKYQLSASMHYDLHEIVDLINDISAQKLDIKWGARPYRRNEVMQVPQLFAPPKGWGAKVELKQGLIELIGNKA